VDQPELRQGSGDAGTSSITRNTTALLWIDVHDDVQTLLDEGDPGIGAIGVGVYVMAAGAALALIGGILMRVRRPKRGRET